MREGHGSFMMKRIMVLGSGGSPAANFIRSLRDSPEHFWIVGTEVSQYEIFRSEANETYITPFANHPGSIEILQDLIEKTNTEFIHAQPDVEIVNISKNRNKLEAITFLPKHRTVEICTDKVSSFNCWKKAGLQVPETILVNNENDLIKSMEAFGPKIWIREISGAFGKGSLATENFDLARSWVNYKNGWGRYSAASCLTPESVTWSSIWKDGELIVAQGRKRLYWELGNRSPSGVTGVTGAGITVADTEVDDIAQRAIYAIDKNPNGLFSVDMTYDNNGVPNPTEINIGRFFTTIYFFTKAGLNMPYIFVKLAYDEKIPEIKKKMNPLTSGLCWIRGVDFLPVLTNLNEIKKYEEMMEKWKR